MDAMESCQRTDEDQNDEGKDERRDYLLCGGGDLGQSHRQEEQENERSDEAIHELRKASARVCIQGLLSE